MIGIPAREVESVQTTDRFSAYALGRDENDPMLRLMSEWALKSTQHEEQIAQLRREIEQLSQKVSKG